MYSEYLSKNTYPIVKQYEENVSLLSGEINNLYAKNYHIYYNTISKNYLNFNNLKKNYDIKYIKNYNNFNDLKKNYDIKYIKNYNNFNDLKKNYDINDLKKNYDIKYINFKKNKNYLDKKDYFNKIKIYNINNK
jgi:hypothetical protein